MPVLDELAAMTQRESRHFHAVMHKIDYSKLRAKGLHYLKPARLGEHRRLSDAVGSDPARRLVAVEPGQHGRSDGEPGRGRDRRLAGGIDREEQPRNRTKSCKRPNNARRNG